MRHIVQEELKRGRTTRDRPHRGGAGQQRHLMCRAGATNLSRLAHTIMCSHSCDTVLVRALRVCRTRKYAAQRRLSEAEAEMDIRNWEQRSADIQTQRDKINLCGEWKMRNRQNVAQKKTNKLRNYEESVAKTQQTSENLMNCLCNSRGIPRL